MKHQWVEAEYVNASDYLRGTKRVCRECGAVQFREVVSYDILQGSKYGWRPRAGKCSKKPKSANQSQ